MNAYEVTYKFCHPEALCGEGSSFFIANTSSMLFK